ncbi:flagellar brake protein [Lachnoclostridium phytofermentans]|uniref:Type IV pilus assembly PilZ n=1 Tax=Lachnoclostridium phytofermentans (strain ATCC 700394 / DSM 18823 / ISDg) TaxID=357809 RepID=A9KND6_LACP7|nr:PilZ domain-containing protein [Lachnoclostridium phytofermentans]ABX43053.1 type IV pilus assembly PilZ [Lachnoclostridium phytofermentans ISDg]
MFKDIASVGDKIELVKINNQGNIINESKRHVSVVYELNEADYASIAIPIENSRLIPLEIGEYYLIYIYNKNGFYQCKAKVIKRFRIQSAYAAQIQIISDLEKQQRRQFFRLDIVQDMSFRVLAEDEWDEIKKLQNSFINKSNIQEIMEKLQTNKTQIWQDGFMVDLSGGGLKFNSKEVCNKDDIIQVKFTLESGPKKFLIFAKVISCSEAKNLPNIYAKRIVFLNIKNDEREAIVRYIFEEERKRRNKENRLN